MALEKSELELEATRRQETLHATTPQKAELELASARRKEAQEKAADVEHGEYVFCEGVTWDTVKAGIRLGFADKIG